MELRTQIVVDGLNSLIDHRFTRMTCGQSESTLTLAGGLYCTKQFEIIRTAVNEWIRAIRQV